MVYIYIHIRVITYNPLILTFYQHFLKMWTKCRHPLGWISQAASFKGRRLGPEANFQTCSARINLPWGSKIQPRKIWSHSFNGWNIRVYAPIKLGPTRCWFQIILYFHPKNWGRFPIWRAYFSDGLETTKRKPWDTQKAEMKWDTCFKALGSSCQRRIWRVNRVQNQHPLVVVEAWRGYPQQTQGIKW